MFSDRIWIERHCGGIEYKEFYAIAVSFCMIGYRCGSQVEADGWFVRKPPFGAGELTYFAVEMTYKSKKSQINIYLCT